MASVRCITFDLDDTLWDTGPVLVRAEAEMTAWIAEHMPRVTERYDADALLVHRQAFYATLPELAHDFTALRLAWMTEIARSSGYPPELAERGFRHFWEARNRVELFDHVLDALSELGERYRLGTITNGNADVHHIGIGHHFAFAVTAIEAGAAKPDREIFDFAVDSADVEPDAIVHVGDDPVRDVEGAQRAGLRAVWVNRTGERWTGEQPPDGEVSGIEELAALIESW